MFDSGCFLFFVYVGFFVLACLPFFKLLCISTQQEWWWEGGEMHFCSPFFPFCPPFLRPSNARCNWLCTLVFGYYSHFSLFNSSSSYFSINWLLGPRTSKRFASQKRGKQLVAASKKESKCDTVWIFISISQTWQLMLILLYFFFIFYRWFASSFRLKKGGSPLLSHTGPSAVPTYLQLWCTFCLYSLTGLSKDEFDLRNTTQWQIIRAFVYVCVCAFFTPTFLLSNHQESGILQVQCNVI